MSSLGLAMLMNVEKGQLQDLLTTNTWTVGLDMQQTGVSTSVVANGCQWDGG